MSAFSFIPEVVVIHFWEGEGKVKEKEKKKDMLATYRHVEVMNQSGVYKTEVGGTFWNDQRQRISTFFFFLARP